MESHIKIVDLFGLPGCGKTTLENELLKQDETDGLHFCNMTEVSQQYRKESLFCKLMVFPYRVCILWTLFFLLMPKLQRKDWRIYWSTYLISIIYAYCHSVKSDKVMLVDHGIIQSVSSLMYGRISNLTSCHSKILRRILHLLDIDYCIYCQVSPEISLERMRLRNRQDSGRLDSIESNNDLLASLNTVFCIFSHLEVNIPSIRNLDMKNDPVSVYKCFREIIRKI